MTSIRTFRFQQDQILAEEPLVLNLPFIFAIRKVSYLRFLVKNHRDGKTFADFGRSLDEQDFLPELPTEPLDAYLRIDPTGTRATISHSVKESVKELVIRLLETKAAAHGAYLEVQLNYEAYENLELKREWEEQRAPHQAIISLETGLPYNNKSTFTEAASTGITEINKKLYVVGPKVAGSLNSIPAAITLRYHYIKQLSALLEKGNMRRY